MAKKTTRQRKEIAQQRAIQQAAANVALSAARAGAPVTALDAPAAARRIIDTGDEYKHVRSDLRRIAVLAIGIIAVLIALSFVIR